MNKNAHDLYRILRAVTRMSLWLRSSGSCTTTGVDTQRNRRWSSSSGCFRLDRRRWVPVMAGQAEEGIGDPTVVPASASFLAADVVEAVRRQTR